MRAAFLLAISLWFAIPAKAEIAQIADIPAQSVVDAIRQVDAVEGIDSLYAACPADVFESRTSLWTRLVRGDTSVTFEFCKKNYDRCTALCIVEQDAKACINTARVLENRREDGAKVASRKAYVLGCALGRAGGCTNRGAGLRNRIVEGDPMQATRVDLTACLFRTFAQACDAGDSWGCAMSGQTYQLGEGVAADPNRAAVLFEQACALASSPRFAACKFAQDKLRALQSD